MVFPTIDPSSPSTGGHETVSTQGDSHHQQPFQGNCQHDGETPGSKVPVDWERDLEDATLDGDFKAIQERMNTLTRTRELEEAGTERRRRSSRLNGTSTVEGAKDTSAGFFRYEEGKNSSRKLHRIFHVSK